MLYFVSMCCLGLPLENINNLAGWEFSRNFPGIFASCTLWNFVIIKTNTFYKATSRRITESSGKFLDSKILTLNSQPLLTVFLVFWIVTNVISGFFALPTLNNFYHWGYGWPLYHTVSAAKCIIFGTKDYIGLNFGVLIAWMALNLAIFPLGIIRAVSVKLTSVTS